MPKASLEIDPHGIVTSLVKSPSMATLGGAILLKFYRLIINSRWCDFVIEISSSNDRVPVMGFEHWSHLSRTLASTWKIVLDHGLQEVGGGEEWIILNFFFFHLFDLVSVQVWFHVESRA